MARRDIGTRWDRENRNNINENFRELYDVQDRAIEEATQAVIDSAKLLWLEPVKTFTDITTTYPNPEVGHTVFVRDTGKVYRFYDGAWMEIQQIDAGPVNEVDTRLSAEIEENRQEIEQARTKADGTTFPVLRDRLNDVDDQIGILSNKLINVVSVNKIQGSTDDTTTIENAVNQLDGTRLNILRFEKNDWIVKRKINIPVSNVIIDFNNSTITWDGTGEDSIYTGVFQFLGQKTTTSTTISVDEPEKTNTITVVDASIFTVGDYIHIKTPPGATDPKDIYNSYFTRIDKIVGNTLYVDYQKRLGATASLGVTVTKVNPVQNIVIKNAHFVAKNQTARTNGMGGLYLAYATNVLIENTSFKGFWFKGVKTLYCTDVYIKNIVVRDPAATGGGEGYGIQFENSHKCKVENGRFHNVRHGTDATASSWIVFQDCITTNGKSVSYSLHKAYEYEIRYLNCHSIADESGGFALGGLNTGFADISDNIYLDNCTVTEATGYGLQATGKGENLYINNCSFSLKNGVVGHAFSVTQNNTYINNCAFNGSLTVSNITGAKNDGVVQISNVKLIQQSNNRALRLIGNVKVTIENSFILGKTDIDENVELTIINSKIKTIGEDGLFNYTGTTSDNIIMSLINCDVEVTGTGSTTYTWKGKKIRFIGCKFTNQSTRPFYMNNKVTEVFNSTGILRMIISAIANFEMTLKDNNFNDGQISRVLDILNSTGDLYIIDNIIKMLDQTYNAIVASTGNTLNTKLIGNRIVGNVALDGSTKGIFKNNDITGTTVTLPASSASIIVGDNLINV